jgi:acylphosphatase
MKKQIHVWYAGRVQGVGFRMSAEDAARPYDVVGWVKNLRDGRVELVAEGEDRVLKQFLDDIRGGPMKNFIQRVDIDWLPATGEFREFEIRYF